MDTATPLPVDQLSKGGHSSATDGACVIEALNICLEQPFGDQRPECMSVAWHKLLMGLNDRMPDEMRQQLWPYALRALNTADDGLEQQRLYLLADWAVRVCAPIALDARGHPDDAKTLRGLPAIADRATARAAAAYTAYAAAAYDAYAAAAYADAYAAAAAAYAAAYADAYADAYAAAADAWSMMRPFDVLDRMLALKTPPRDHT